MTAPADMAAMLDELLARERPCTLCGAPPALCGVFIPDSPLLYGAAPGRKRVIFYSLCAACFALPSRERNDRVQAGIAAAFAPAAEGHA